MMTIVPTQQNKPNIPDWVLYVLVILLVLLLAGGFTGCNPVNKATQQVLTNSVAFNKVGAVWAKLNPCVVDSTQTLVHDTTFKTDTLYKHVTNNSSQTNTTSVVKPAYKSTADTILKTITNTITLHDSIKVVSVDKRALGIYADSVNYYKLAFANYKASSVVQIASLQHKATTRLWLLIGIALALVVYVFRKPLLALVTGGASLLTKII